MTAQISSESSPCPLGHDSPTQPMYPHSLHLRLIVSDETAGTWQRQPHSRAWHALCNPALQASETAFLMKNHLEEVSSYMDLKVDKSVRLGAKA